MKKLLFVALMALAVAGSAFKADDKKIMELVKASDVEEFCNLKGQVIGSSQKKSENQLPIQGKRTFAKMFDGYQIKQAIHYKEADGEAFYITAENEKESVIVKIDDKLEVSIFKKIKEQ